MNRILFWGIMLVIVGFAMVYAPWIVLIGQDFSYEENNNVTTSLKSVNDAEKVCNSGIEIEERKEFCNTVNLIKKSSYVVIGAGMLLFIIGTVIDVKERA